MKYILMEIQKSSEGVVSTIVSSYDDEPHAEAAFYSLLSVCTLSSLPKHGALLMTEDGVVCKAEMYRREVDLTEE